MTFTSLEAKGTDGTWAPVTSPPTVDPASVLPVSHAGDDTARDAADITGVFGDDNRFHIGGDLYTYDDGDTFLDGGDTLTLDEFETKIGVNLETITTEANIQVVFYDDDGTSIFKVISDAS